MSKKDLFLGIFIVLALVVFARQEFFFKTLPNELFGGGYAKNNLRIVLQTPLHDLSPYSLSLDDLIRTGNIFEGLVAFDRTLKIVPALAVTWGNVDPLTWDFKLRKEVTFHDGSPFTAQSVVDSYEEGKKNGGGQLGSLLSTIQEIKVIEPFEIQIVTIAPDPLILSKLTKFFIHRENNVGTGPYQIKQWEKGVRLLLTAYPNYWGQRPAYQNAEYAVTQNKVQRQSDFDQGLTDILVAVPKEEAINLPKDQVKSSYSLEVNFMMFKLDDPLLKDRAMREAIQAMIDPAKIEEVGNNFVRRVSQFVAPGVFGFNPDLPQFQYDEAKSPKNLFGEQKMKITMDYLSTYKTLVEYLEKQFEGAGFQFKGNPIEADELLDHIRKNESQLYILGWQSENGDAGDFLDAFISSKGEFNNGRYANPAVDRLIEKARQELNPELRLELLQKIMELVNDDLIGIPLFESARLYAVKKGLLWEPRLDGLVLAKEVR
jgi:peptide/nickel transport system substrate-binding protein